MAKSQGNTASAEATLNTVNRRRGVSANHLALKSVNEVFSATENKAKFCMPLGLNSAREIEKCIKKDRDEKNEQKNKRKKMQLKPVLNSKQIHA